MIPSAEHAAVELIASVLRGKTLAHDLPQALQLQGNQGGGAGRLQDLVSGTLRHLGTLRALLRVLAPRGVDSPVLEALLLAGLYQLQFARTPDHAVVHTAVALSRQLGFSGASGFTNAVLRRFQRERESLLVQAIVDDVSRWSHPQWWIDRLRAQYPARFESILQAGLWHPPMALRVNSRRVTNDAYVATLQHESIDVKQLSAPNGALLLSKPQPSRTLPGFSEGQVSIQDAGAQWAAPLLDLSDEQRVLDACAAPGGKSAHILERANVSLLGLDLDAARLGDAERNLKRLGLAATLKVADVRDVARWWDGELFDRILLDAPCSASGIVRRHPDAKWLRREEDLAAFARTQAQLLNALWPVLQRGGKLLYATCSVFAEENVATVAAFQDRTPDAIRLELAGFPEPSGQLLPEEEHDGFFYALLQKR